MLAWMCNNCCLFHRSQVMPNRAWRCFTAHLLNTIFTNKIDCFTDCDGDSQIMFESIFTITSLGDWGLTGLLIKKRYCHIYLVGFDRCIKVFVMLYIIIRQCLYEKHLVLLITHHHDPILLL